MHICLKSDCADKTGLISRKANEEPEQLQLTLFDDVEEIERKQAEEKAARAKERRLQEAAIKLKKKYGKNAILKGMNLEEGATTLERNKHIGGHRSGE